ncbi:Galactoside Alpha-(1,2)-Fucosyltransferase 2 [Manis pentadactyla]|nr:Galactoside Alpha-(1,2)-Fucosyltransferase 2 [Manis pentadactyla]
MALQPGELSGQSLSPPPSTTAAITGFWATCASFSAIDFLFVIFVVSTTFHCHRRLALVPTPWAYPGRVVLVP